MNKFLKFIKNNIYYIFVILALVIMVSVILISASSESEIPTNTEVEIPETVVTEVNSTTTPNYIAPLSNFSILKDYSSTNLMYNATLNRWESHKSIDFSANSGDNVLAIADGVVKQVYTNYLEGTVVVIEHSNNLQSLYSSLSSDVTVKVGDNVSQGDVIGKVGDTAKSEFASESHLHFELFYNGEKVDPSQYIAFSEK